MSERLSTYETQIIRIGVFVLFLVTFGDYVIKKVWAVIGPLFQ